MAAAVIGRRQRLMLGLLAGVLTITVAVVLTARFVLRAEWWQVDHKVTTEPAPRLADLGPPPGALVPAWQQSTRVHRGRLSAYDRVAYGMVEGQLVVVSGYGLEVRDGRNRKMRWSYHRDGWALLGWAVTGNRLVAYLERAGHRDDRMLLGFDAATGRLLWRREGAAPAVVARTTLRWPAGSGVVLAAGPGRRSVDGRSATTGARLWSTRLPEGCRLPDGAARPSDGDEWLTVLALECGAPRESGERSALRHRVLALDPATGAVRWDRAFGFADLPEVAVAGDATLVSDDSGLRVYGRHGGQLASWSGEDMCDDQMCPATVYGDHLIVVHKQDDGARMEAVDLESGQNVWRRDVPAYSGLTTAGGLLYALRPRLAAGLLPAGIDMVNPADGSATTVPAPLTVEEDLDAVQPWLAAGGGLLYVAVPAAAPRPTGGGQLFALRGGPDGPGPVELGGVEAADWPDACGLLEKPDLTAARLSGASGRPGADVRIGPVTLPHPVSCTYDPLTTDPESLDHTERSVSANGTKAPGLTVTVKWVATDSRAASGMLAALCAAQSQVRQRTDIGGDEAYELGPTGGLIVVRVDRYVVSVSGSRPPGAAARVARVTAARLQDLHSPSPIPTSTQP